MAGEGANPTGTLTITTFTALDGVMQAPGGPDEDRDGGFEHGQWSFPYFSDATWVTVNGRHSSKAACSCSGGGRTRSSPAARPSSRPGRPGGVEPQHPNLSNVVRRHLQCSIGQPTTIIRGDIPAEVAKLKDQTHGESRGPRQRGAGRDVARGLGPDRRVAGCSSSRSARHRQAAVRARGGADRPAGGQQQAHGQGNDAGDDQRRRAHYGEVSRWRRETASRTTDAGPADSRARR